VSKLEIDESPVFRWRRGGREGGKVRHGGREGGTGRGSR